jgi:hypothetical protein
LLLIKVNPSNVALGLRIGTWRALLLLSVDLVTLPKHRCNGSRFAAVVVMLSLWVATYALEVSPSLHNLLHRDASSPTHNCLVTRLQHHSPLVFFGPVLAPTPPVAWSPLDCPRESNFATPADYRLSPSRAPPLG